MDGVKQNYWYGSLCLVGTDPRVCPDFGQSQGITPTGSLPEVVQWFKAITTKRYMDGVKQNYWYGSLCLVGTDPRVCPDFGQSQGIAPTF